MSPVGQQVPECFATSANPGPQDVEQIEHRRETNPDMDALYIISPMTHIVDCLMADFDRKRYRKARLVWTSGQYYCCPMRSPLLVLMLELQFSIPHNAFDWNDLKWPRIRSQSFES